MATIYQRGKSWYLDWREGGERHRQALGPITGTEAKKIKALKEAELASGIALFSSAPGFSDYADEYLEWYKYEHPASYARCAQIVHSHLKPAFGTYALDQLEPRLVELYKARRGAAVKSETVAKEIRTLKAMMNRALDWGVINTHPFPRVKAPKNLDSKPPRFYTVEELRLIYAAAPNHRWIWQLLANTGLRRTEALQLKKECDLGTKLRVLSGTEARTKSGKWREIPLSPGAREALNRLGEVGGYIIPRSTGPSLSRAFANTLRRAGLDGNLHCLRHSFCSHLVMQGVPLRTVQILAGHSTFAVTERYAHLAPEYLAKAIGGLNL
jgi:integrase